MTVDDDLEQALRRIAYDDKLLDVACERLVKHRADLDAARARIAELERKLAMAKRIPLAGPGGER